MTAGAPKRSQKVAEPENLVTFPFELGSEAAKCCNQMQKSQFTFCFSCVFFSCSHLINFVHTFPFFISIHAFPPVLHASAACLLAWFFIYLRSLSFSLLEESGILYILRISKTSWVFIQSGPCTVSFMLIFNFTNF